MSWSVNVQKTLRDGPRSFQLDVGFDTPAQRVVLFGPSGSGKSQTLRAIAGLSRPDAGWVRVQGVSLFDSCSRVNLPARARRLGHVFQDYALFPHLNVTQNIGFGLQSKWWNPSPNRIDTAVQHWLDRFELGPVAALRPENLSGGQRQRTALARALVGQPRALLLDEPFAALDRALRERLRDELDELQTRLAIPMLIISHDETDVHRFGEHVVELRQGRNLIPGEPPSVDGHRA